MVSLRRSRFTGLPVPLAADHHIQGLLRGQMRMVGLHRCDHGIDGTALKRMHGGGPGAVDVAQLRIALAQLHRNGAVNLDTPGSSGQAVWRPRHDPAALSFEDHGPGAAVQSGDAQFIGLFDTEPLVAVVEGHHIAGA